MEAACSQVPKVWVCSEKLKSYCLFVNTFANYFHLSLYFHFIFGRRLALLVRVIFPIPAASSKSERVFSVAGRIVTPDRNRLAPELVEDLVTMKCNLRLLRNLPSVWAFHMCHLDQPEIYLPIIVESGFQKFKRIQFSLGRWNAQIGDETCQLSRGTCQNFSPSLLSPWESLSSRSSGDLCKMDQTDLYFSWRLISYFSALIWTNLTTALLDRVIISY